MKTERCAILCRVSADGQKLDGSSLDHQERECRAYAAERGYAVVLFEAEQGSGATLDRPGLTRVLAAIERGEVDVLLSLALDRLSRKQTHVAIVADVCESHEARLEFVTEDFEESSVGTFIRGAKAFAAELEREKIRYRTMNGKAERLTAENVPTWTCDLYGYRTVRPTKEQRRANPGLVGRREVVPSEGTVVVEVFEAVVAGHSRQAIEDTLNTRGVDSPGVTRMRYEDQGHHPRWQPSSIGQMVANPAYQGLTVANRLTRRKVRNPVTGNVNKKRQVTRPEEEWTVVGQPGELTSALVEPDLWRNANEHLSANRGSRTRNAQAPMLLRNRVYCAVCGGLLHAEHSTRPGRRSYYRCKASHPEQYRTPNVQGRTPASLAVA